MKEELFILWTNDNPITSEKMVCMYAYNAKKYGWWADITVIIWGATAKLVAEDVHIQGKVIEMIEAGVKVSACKACADQLGVSGDIEALGIEFIYWGEPLTEIIKKDKKLITV